MLLKGVDNYFPWNAKGVGKGNLASDGDLKPIRRTMVIKSQNKGREKKKKKFSVSVHHTTRNI